jgi:hypothetical protein
MVELNMWGVLVLLRAVVGRNAKVRRPIGAFKLLAQKLVFHNSELNLHFTQLH